MLDFAIERELWDKIEKQIAINEMPPEAPFLSGDPMGQEWETELRSVPENTASMRFPLAPDELPPAPQTPQDYDVQDGMKTSTKILCIISIVFLASIFVVGNYYQQKGAKQAEDAIKRLRGVGEVVVNPTLLRA
jgi:hypothetical protein